MKKIILIGSPHHGNLGDSAIAFAEEKFIKESLTDINFFSVPQENALPCINALKNHIADDDLLALHGGGNMGVDYFLAEEIRREYIKTFKNNKIILFPQTIDFGKTDLGKYELDISTKIYSEHKNLFLFARERPSYNIMKNTFINNSVELVPDIVTYLDETFPTFKRKGVLLSLRKDKEKVLSDVDTNKLENIVSKYFSDIKYKDTVLKHMIPENRKLEFLNNIWNNFKSAKLVITDRLHGMIFSAITSTPCIVMKNYNHKIEASYNEWFTNLPYIKFANSINEIDCFIQELSKLDNCIYNNFSKDNFEPLKQILSKNR